MENETKHTPGPWKFNDDYVRATDGTPVADVWLDNPKEDEDANAALIAAAPDLLAQLRQLYAAHKFSLDTGAAYVVDEMAVRFMAAAIAKAEAQP